MKPKYELLSTFKTKNEKETFCAAQNFSSNFSGGEIVVLFGDIGAGKTVFVSGIAKGLKCSKKPISSSFNLARIYKGEKISLAHFDLFRLKNPKEVDFGLEDYLSKDYVVAIEWPLPAESVYSRFSHHKVVINLKGKDKREIKIYES
ncbi:MAG: tRNA (adenosine(37)-N6)-threonylcarbamoyltransferase complex ATPase subunit type 1 TsaE [Elusimicrobia bacterium]|nr:tRNA (adenosine(37)-N6)-threonylcarbamoyltransferase complex ATPase subunit type 1 TsaE [Elusimicrobiota bacterium]